MFPGQMRRPWRREIFLVFFCSVCFLSQIPLTAQVRCRPVRSTQTHQLALSYWRSILSDTADIYLFSVVQGGVFLFQLMDYYGANGVCVLFVSLIQCVAAGWAFGECYYIPDVVVLSVTSANAESSIT